MQRKAVWELMRVVHTCEIYGFFFEFFGGCNSTPCPVAVVHRRGDVAQWAADPHKRVEQPVQNVCV